MIRRKSLYTINKGIETISITLPYDIFELPLVPSDFMVYSAVVHLSGNFKEFPTQEQIAELTGLSRKTVCICLQRLNDVALLDYTLTKDKRVTV